MSVDVRVTIREGDPAAGAIRRRRPVGLANQPGGPQKRQRLHG
eukprot:CAMPEP_0183481876 /NCGR_PEP_ID=MMETSP0370-20130417/175649_1 /TAXON_ID=268820 /ORGANISM="Peridinium aciculiferum, Strain PAER-2" /LENGTH=42 /DNA_ID= /DNA_START= /DNA_END= /DNA_ORIENTATION=